MTFTGGISVFVETPDHLGGTLYILDSFHQQGTGTYQNSYFAYRDDVHGLDINIVEVELTLFERSPAPQTRIFNDTGLQLDTFAANEALELLPVHAGNADNRHLVHT